MTDIKHRQKQLFDRLVYLQLRLEKIEAQLEIAPNPDWEDSATEHEDDEMLEDLVNKGRIEIHAIKAALARIESGTFGACTNCSETIQEERLDLVVHTPFCKICAQKTSADRKPHHQFVGL